MKPGKILEAPQLNPVGPVGRPTRIKFRRIEPQLHAIDTAHGRRPDIPGVADVRQFAIGALAVARGPLCKSGHCEKARTEQTVRSENITGGPCRTAGGPLNLPLHPVRNACPRRGHSGTDIIPSVRSYSTMISSMKANALPPAPKCHGGQIPTPSVTTFTYRPLPPTALEKARVPIATARFTSGCASIPVWR